MRRGVFPGHGELIHCLGEETLKEQSPRCRRKLHYLQVVALIQRRALQLLCTYKTLLVGKEILCSPEEIHACEAATS